MVSVDALLTRHQKVSSSGSNVRAARVASDGWELHVLEGARELFATAPPDALLVEVTPARLFLADEEETIEEAMRRTFAWLFASGYARAAHAGKACDARLAFETNEVRVRSIHRPKRWCAFAPDASDVASLARLACPEHPETILLLRLGETKSNEKSNP
jgi:hypothetical protein